MAVTISKPAAGQPIDEPGRLRALEALGLLDSLPEIAFDRHTECLKLSLKADVCLVSLVDSTRQFFKSQIGLPSPYCDIRSTPLSHSFCQFVVKRGEPLRIVDARTDPLVQNNPAIGDLGVIAYLGTPLLTDDGFILGSLCAICNDVRSWTDNDLRILQLTAESVMSEVRLRTASRLLAESLYAGRLAENERDAILHALVHDMRTPVSAIISSLELLGENLPLNPDQTELIGVIGKMSEQLLDMMNGMLFEHHLESGRKIPVAPVDVTTLLRHAFETARPLAVDAGQTLHVVYPEPNTVVEGDESLLYRVLLNLLTNAVKFSPHGGRILLAAQNGPGICTIHVTDNGPGIPDDEKSAIFNRHVRGTNRPGAGKLSFGLGLDFCRRAVAAHGGIITVADAPGGGSDFSFSLPQKPALA